MGKTAASLLDHKKEQNVKYENGANCQASTGPPSTVELKIFESRICSTQKLNKSKKDQFVNRRTKL